MPDMERAKHYLEESDEQTPPPSRQYTSQHAFGGEPGPLEDSWRNLYRTGVVPVDTSSHHSSPPSTSVYTTPYSPLQTTNTMVSTTHESPSSLYLANSSNTSMSPPSTIPLPKLQQQQQQQQQQQSSSSSQYQNHLYQDHPWPTQPVTTSHPPDAQTHQPSTSNSKPKPPSHEPSSTTTTQTDTQTTLLLTHQLHTLETTVSSLQQSRAEARSTLRTTAAQYMRILDLANRLQVKGQQERRDWAREKAGLEERVRGLEEVVVCGVGGSSSSSSSAGGAGGAGGAGAEKQKVASGKGAAGQDEDADRDLDLDLDGGGGTAGQLHVIPLLRAEVARLRERNRVLEGAVERMRDEGLAVQEAARSIAEAGRLV